jgi:hypothetical protein
MIDLGLVVARLMILLAVSVLGIMPLATSQ